MVESVASLVVVDNSHWLVVVNVMAMTVAMVVVMVMVMVIRAVVDDNWLVVAISVALVFVVHDALVVVFDHDVWVLSVIVDLSALDGWLCWADRVGFWSDNDWLWSVSVVELGII